MTTRFISDDPWDRITHLAGTTNEKRYAAAPFVGAGASSRLPLSKGDVLVTRFDDASFKEGVVDPREIVKYLKRGVEVHSVLNLHAKVFVFGSRAVVGSTNISDSSAKRLIEAVCESNDRAFVSSARTFIKSLLGETVELEYAKRKIGLYKPPVFLKNTELRKTKSPQQAALIAVRLALIDYDDVDSEYQQKGSIKASEKLDDDDHFKIETFRWTGALPKGLQPGTRVLMCTAQANGRIDIDPPARVLNVQKYRSSRGGARALVFVEVRKRLRSKSLSTVLKRIPSAKILRGARAIRELSDYHLVFSLGQLWPSVE